MKGPNGLFYSLFWWCYPATVLRNKAANCVNGKIRILLLRKSGIPVEKGCEIGYGTIIVGMAKRPPAVTFGKRVAVAPYVVFISSSYPDFSKLGEHPEVKSMIQKLGPIVVENDCWIGARSIIFPNVKIGRGSIVGAGSIVRESIPPFSVVVGSPAKIIRTLNSYVVNNL